MDTVQAKHLSDKCCKPRHLYFSEFRNKVAAKLNSDALLARDGCAGIACIEVILSKNLPYGTSKGRAGIYALVGVNEYGLWANDGDGHHDEPTWRQHLIPWRIIDGIILHQVS